MKEQDEDSANLRAELKQWERDFASRHDGRRAGREDIKKVPEIAEKYKAYDKLRRQSKQSSYPQECASPAKRSSSQVSILDEAERTTADCFRTPNKKAKHSHHQPSHPTATAMIRPWNIDPYDPPISCLLSPSRARSSIGPTPEKNGRVLGLFDALSNSGGSGGRGKTPSKRREALLPLPENIVQISTPSRMRGGKLEAEQDGLPQNASGRRQQGLMAASTPSRKRTEIGNTPNSSHRSIAKLLQDETPAFLRRRNQNARPVAAMTAQGDEDSEDGASWSPIAVRRLRPPVGRGLSALVKKLREMEEEHLDEEMQMLREVETGDAHLSPKALHKAAPIVLVQESQAAELPLGPDCAIESEDDLREANHVEKETTEKMKKRQKKGQKRTTRRVVMRPTMTKWQPEPKWEAGMETEDEDEGGTTVIGETQVESAINGNDSEQDESRVDSDLAEYQSKAKKKSGHSNSRIKPKEADKVPSNQASAKHQEESVTRKLKKKISATAHANFRALKIKNKNSKGKRSGRFGGKRR